MSAFFRSFTFAFKGIKVSLMQRNFKVMATAAIFTIILAGVCHVTITEWCILIICMGVVLALEIVNTAIEAFVDLVQPEFHPVAGKIKDLSAAAVLVFSAVAFVCGLLIFWKYLILLL